MTISYNGIPLPGEWPPRHIGVGDDPLPVPYLSSPPAVVPVDVGRQLFVDDFLIERTTLKRVYHAAEVHEAAPVLSPETELELNRGQCPVAAPFNDGAWYDPADGIFKLFYQAGWYDGAAMATSDDGINWRRPIQRQ
ncbi:MAG: glycoside hydrolase family 32 protein [Gammaproteobacteria bacterium]|nr:glycoside hydrolase family 32 protein [Gammaproteobacteria bacterium]